MDDGDDASDLVLEPQRVTSSIFPAEGRDKSPTNRITNTTPAVYGWRALVYLVLTTSSSNWRGSDTTPPEKKKKKDWEYGED